MDNPYLASQHIENNTQQSTNKQITNRLNTKEQIDKEDKEYSYVEIEATLDS